MKFDDEDFDSNGEDDWVIYLWISALILTVTTMLITIGS